MSSLFAFTSMLCSLGMSYFVSAAPVVTDACQALDDPVSTCPQTTDPQSPGFLEFAVLGDSWASGVAYSAAVQYDDNSDGCLRATETYANYMLEDVTWADETPLLDFVACSGSHLVDIVRGRQQLSQAGDASIIVMTVGGNDALFFPIAVNCIYQPVRYMDYGPAYDEDTKRTGLCAQAIDNSRNYIQNTMANDLRVTYEGIQDYLKTNGKQSSVRVYHTGYAQFFNADEEWCNNESFGAVPAILPGSNQPKLSQQLRMDINNLILQVNDLIKQNVGTYDFGYVDIDWVFEDQRFCEAGGTHYSQYYGEDVYFWNLSLQGVVANENSTEVTPDNGPLFTGNGTIEVENVSSGNGSVSDGWQMRPFHPNPNGHSVIKYAIIQQMQEDGVPGVKASA